MDVVPEQAHRGHEAYEHLGEVQTCALDLDAAYVAFVEERHIRVSESEADVVFEIETAVPPPVLWDWLNDPHKRISTWTTDGIPDEIRIGAHVGLQRSRQVMSLPTIRTVVARQRAAWRWRLRRSVLRRSWP